MPTTFSFAMQELEMAAQIYPLDAIRPARNTPMSMDGLSSMQLASDGLGLLLSATSFWVECSVVAASFQAAILLAAFSR